MKRTVLGLVMVLVVGLVSAFPAGASSGSPGRAPQADRASGTAVVASGAGLTLTTDHTGLFVPGETATLTIAGAANLSTVMVRQCSVAVDACGPASYLTVGASGGGTASVVVHRRLPGLNRDKVVDCGTQPCAFVAEQRTASGAETASAPMTVDPDASIPRPTLRIVEPGPFGDFASVSVTGSGFDPGSYVGFAECSWNPPAATFACVGLDAYGFVDTTGTLSSVARVTRVVERTDCAARFGRCQLWAFPAGSIDQIWAVQLGFDGTDPVVPSTVDVSPSTDLAHRQVVTVTGSHFAPGGSVQLAACLVSPPVGSQPCGTTTYGSVTAAGTFATPFVVPRQIGGADCAVEDCVIRTYGPPAPVVDVPISFDASIPPPPPPILTVDPTTDLVDRQTVSVEVTELDRGNYVTTATCVTGGDLCRSSGSLTVPAGGGTATATIAVFRVPAEGIDCALVACEVRVMISGSGTRILSAPITFDPDAALADPPVLRVLPGSGLWDHQTVEVRGEGFDPGSQVSISQCAGDPAPGLGCESATSWTSVGSDGRFGSTISVKQELDLGADAIDCLVTTCSIAASINGTSPTTSAPIAFDADAPPDASDLPPQLDCVTWPTEQWPVGDIPAGVDAAAVEAMGQQMVGAGGGSSVVVIHGGRLVYENYRTGVTAATVLPSASMSKSFTSTMVGLLVDDGVLDIDAPGLFPEWSAPGDVRGTMTTRNLLHMSSGLQWTEDYVDATSDVIRLVNEPDAAAFVVAKPAAVAPGTRFAYSTGDTMLLSRVIGDAAGVSGPTYEALLQDRLFGPLGIEPVSAGFDLAGRWRAGWWTNTTTRNFAKLGLLYLRNGVWEDQQFLSTDWVDFVRTPSPDYSGYGGQFWLNGDGSFSMIGYGGQTVLIVPRLDLIVAVNNGGSAQSMAQLFAAAEPATCADDDAMALADDAASTSSDQSVLVDVLANDHGGASGLAPATLTVASGPAHGVATVEAGAIRYQPDDGFTGSDSFAYLVCSNLRRPCLQATVDVAVDLSGRPS